MTQILTHTGNKVLSIFLHIQDVPHRVCCLSLCGGGHMGIGYHLGTQKSPKSQL